MNAFIDLGEHFVTTLARDVSDLSIGKHISTGTTRAVYQYANTTDQVLKLENNAYSFCNIYEHQIWDRVRDTEFAKWFAPVIHISSNGVALVMRRTQPARLEDLPKHIPAFFTDVKAENFGWMDGRIVCHDYAFHRFIERGMTKRMRLANWESKETKV